MTDIVISRSRAQQCAGNITLPATAAGCRIKSKMSKRKRAVTGRPLSHIVNRIPNENPFLLSHTTKMLLDKRFGKDIFIRELTKAQNHKFLFYSCNTMKIISEIPDHLLINNRIA